jgi:ATP-binding cassette, subfamily B, bacterial CvaB/MchF/RaxB
VHPSELLNLGGRKATPYIQQSEASECALACIAMIAGFHGLETDLIVLRRRFELSLKGATLKQVMHVAGELGFSTRPLRGEIENLEELALPTILHWDLNHFVVLTKITRGLKGQRFHIHDPASGVKAMTTDELSRHFTGVALELVKSERFQARSERSKLRITQLWSSMQGFWPAFGQIITLSLILQLAALASPFFLQVGIDTVFPSFDHDLLWILALGFGGLAVVTMITSWLRSLVLISLGSALSYQVVVNLFRHLLRLPLPWFEKRHVGDVISRFGSTQPISDLLSQGLIAAVIDGTMAVITLVLMFVYSPILAFVALVALAAYIMLRLVFLQALTLRSIDAISASAAENSAFIESIRGISTIKAFGEENNRQRLWQQKKAKAINAQIKLGRLNAGFGAGQQVVIALERVVFIYLAISFAMESAISIGMIFAFQAYKQQFLDAAMRLVEQVINFRLLDVHLGRIADIALNKPEDISLSRRYALDPNTNRSAPTIELKDVWFRYGSNEEDVLKGINLKIDAGEMVAFVGPSGGGKTTLAKIMMGLFVPTRGEVLIDGQPLKSLGLGNWRAMIASIAQDDSLFAGSLADNIAMFDPEPDMAAIRFAAQQANIEPEIEAMPLKYETLVGDMGSVLSGGQKQRVLLARGLYRSPVALFMDEATAHLDIPSEAKVMNVIKQQLMTRVMIAHRPQSIAAATRIFNVAEGKVIELPSEKFRQSGPELQLIQT